MSCVPWPRGSTQRAKGITHVWNSIYLQHLALESRTPADPFCAISEGWNDIQSKILDKAASPAKCWCLQLNLSLCGNVPQALLPAPSACWRLSGSVRRFAFPYSWIIKTARKFVRMLKQAQAGSLCTDGLQRFRDRGLQAASFTSASFPLLGYEADTRNAVLKFIKFNFTALCLHPSCWKAHPHTCPPWSKNHELMLSLLAVSECLMS